MLAGIMGQSADLSTAGSARLVAGATTRERNFYIALACAALLHASFFFGAIRGAPKQLGDPSGAEDAISVSLVTEAELKSRSTVAEPPPPPPSTETPPARQPQPEPQKSPQPEAQRPPPPEPQEQPQPDVAKHEEPQVAKLEDPKTEANAPDLFSLQDQNPANMQSEAKPKAKPKTEPSKSSANKSTASNPTPKTQKKRLSELDLSTPQNIAPSFSGAHAAAFQRPPGITRSGLNDAFARAVIRALQQTMPQLNGALGHVTVRILLSESGNVVEVRLLAGAKDTTLNQDVVFAAQQTSYPIPPAGSNIADRTFMVTYIYD
jgi:TonB family protein